MHKLVLVLLILSAALAACGPAVTPVSAPSPTSIPSATSTSTATPIPSPTGTPTVTPTSTATPLYPPEGMGPKSFPANVNPLTGLKAADPALLDRRPMLIKVTNLPRFVRPQWGLSLADLVFEYYTEEGTTRFAAIFYGNNAEKVGPIRSGRFVDAHLVRGYRAIFAFGFADPTEMVPFLHSDFAERMVVEVPGSPFTRYDPKGADFLMVSTTALSDYITKKGIENGRQDLNGMYFKLETPPAGKPAAQVTAHYSGSIYNRWDYDPATGKYLRFSDNIDVFNVEEVEKYVQLTDRLTKQPIAFDNVVVLFVDHQVYSQGIYNIDFIGSGTGYASRDGKIYPLIWAREREGVVTLDNPDGTSFPLKPGTTWFEVMGLNTTVEESATGWRFSHKMP
jgi:hypothetical protein